MSQKEFICSAILNLRRFLPIINGSGLGHILKFRKQVMIAVLGLILLALPQDVMAYADFIGYGYRSCQVCHVSGAGGGMLTDYGRALFATEIAAKPPWLNVDDEKLGEYSNFLGKTQFPWWVRLGMKYRALTIESNPGSSAATNRYYNMQNDVNMAFFFDKKQTLSFVGTIGYAESALSISPNTFWSNDQYLFSREYYLKYKINREFTLYAGMLDKSFGIRTPDHTANNRYPLGLGQNDQVHGVMLHNATGKSDMFAHIWYGNAQAEELYRMTGGSFMYEYDLGNMLALGGEVLHESNDSRKRTVLAVHAKKGFGHGNSLMGELGYREFESNQKAASAYMWTQGHLKIVRGLFIESTGEYSKDDIESVPERFKWTLGFLWFPMQRVEIRAAARQMKSLNTTTVERDQWYYLTQIHLSL